MTDGVDPWDRQPGESARQHARFTTYLHLGPYRTLTGVNKALTASGDRIGYDSLRQISSAHRWALRADAWDAHQRRDDAERLRQAHRAMIDRHLSAADALIRQALADLDTLSDREGGLSPTDIVRFIKLATDLQWRILGTPTPTVEVSVKSGGPVEVDDLSRFTPAQRHARLRELTEELARRQGLRVVKMDDNDYHAVA